MQIPKLTGREYRRFDWYGWFMCALGGGLMWWTATNQNWFGLILVIFVFLDYVWRVVYGRVYKFVFYDTVIHHVYELKANNDTYYVCAETEEELKLYMHLHYKDIKYSIVDKYPLESFIKTEHYQ